MKTNPPCTPGDLFEVPFESGGCGLVLIVQACPRKKPPGTLYCAGFSDHWAKRGDAVPREVSPLEQIHASWCLDDDVLNGEWRRVGRLDSFSPDDWPLAPVRSSGPGAHKPTLRDNDILHCRIMNREELVCDGLAAAAYMTPSEYLSLPYNHFGGFERCLDRARRGEPNYRIHPDPALWARINNAIIADGLMPIAEYAGPVIRPGYGTGTIWNRDVALWDLVELSRVGAETNPSLFLEQFAQRLRESGPERLPLLAKAFLRRVGPAFEHNHSAAVLINRGCTHESYFYFRAWLIAQGKRVFDRAAYSRDTLAKVVPVLASPGSYLFRGFVDIWSRVAKDLGCPAPHMQLPEYPGYRSRMADVWTAERFKVQVPKLWRRYQKRRESEPHLELPEVPGSTEDRPQIDAPVVFLTPPPPPMPRDKNTPVVPLGDVWTLIRDERVRHAETDDFLEAVRRRIVNAGPKGLRPVLSHIDKSLRKANTWKLWGAAYLANDGCSDDGFLYFRAWLITQGKDIFEQVCKDPDSLAHVPGAFEDGNERECEDLLDLVDAAAAELGVDPPEPSESARENPPAGKQPNFDDDATMSKRYPKLFAMVRGGGKL